MTVQQRRDSLRPRRPATQRRLSSEAPTSPGNESAAERRREANAQAQRRHRRKQKNAKTALEAANADLNRRLEESRNLLPGLQPSLPSAEQIDRAASTAPPGVWDTITPAPPPTQGPSFCVNPPDLSGYVVGTTGEPGETCPGAFHNDNCNSDTKPTADWPPPPDNASCYGWADAYFQAPTTSDYLYTQVPYSILPPMSEPSPIAQPALENIVSPTPIRPPSAITHAADWSSTMAFTYPALPPRSPSNAQSLPAPSPVAGGAAPLSTVPVSSAAMPLGGTTEFAALTHICDVLRPLTQAFGVRVSAGMGNGS